MPMTAGWDRDVLPWLSSKGAATIAHPGGNLLSHLRRTADRLVEWDAGPSLVLAGLCHAAYGTHGFAVALIPVAERSALARLIGGEAEAIVYAYCSVDRMHGLPGVDGVGVTVRDRFTGAETTPSPEVLRQLIELSSANELDVLLHVPEAARPQVAAWLSRCSRLASPRAGVAVSAALRTMNPGGA